MKFLITENMIQQDFSAVKRCYDLKGSTLDRITNLDIYNEILKNINENHWREWVESFERLEPLRLCSEKSKDSSPRRREEQLSLNFESRFKVALKAFAD